MQVSLSRSSWHSRYYNWVKGNYPTFQFKSLCPYFWTIVFYVLCSPLILVYKGVKLLFKNYVVDKVSKMVEKSFESSMSKPTKEKGKVSKWFNSNGEKIGLWFGKIYLGTMGLSFILIMIMSFIQSIGKIGLWMTLVYTFAIIGAFLTLIFVIWGIMSIFETQTWRMIKGMSYSVKNKVCPAIDWK